MWGYRVVVPPQGRNYHIEELHDTHPCISRMKALARSFVWWPAIDKDLEARVWQCDSCQPHRKSPPMTCLHPWEWPQEPWSRIRIDFAGPFMGHNVLIIVDAHSKWLDVHIMSSTTSAATIDNLRRVFATHELLRTIVSDNGTAFTSAEFAQFVKLNGIKHVRTAPFHPASNGLAECTVQTFKDTMKKMKDKSSMETKISQFLMKYRITPPTTTGLCPAELLMKRQVRSHLDLARPYLKARVQGINMPICANFRFKMLFTRVIMLEGLSGFLDASLSRVDQSLTKLNLLMVVCGSVMLTRSVSVTMMCRTKLLICQMHLWKFWIDLKLSMSNNLLVTMETSKM